jgi:hypothetical protein
MVSKIVPAFNSDNINALGKHNCHCCSL